jgi:hypothetical protein
MLLAIELESTTLPDGTTQALGPATPDAFAIFEDLCLLGNGERPQFLQLEHLHMFSLELIESVLTNYHELLRKVSLPSPLPVQESETCMPAVVLKSLSFSQHSEPSAPSTASSPYAPSRRRLPLRGLGYLSSKQ